MVIKKFGVDFHSSGGALTLNVAEVSDCEKNGGFCTRSHESGWTISGEIREDYFVWVNYFVATHPQYGYVRGDFEEEIEAFSEEAFAHFWEHHTPQAWDYMDI